MAIFGKSYWPSQIMFAVEEGEVLKYINICLLKTVNTGLLVIIVIFSLYHKYSNNYNSIWK